MVVVVMVFVITVVMLMTREDVCSGGDCDGGDSGLCHYGGYVDDEGGHNYVVGVTVVVVVMVFVITVVMLMTRKDIIM